MQSPSISSSPVTIEKADEDDEPSVDEEMVEMVGQMRPCGGKRARQRSRRKQDFFVPYTVTPTIPHLKSQKVQNCIIDIGRWHTQINAINKAILLY